MSQTSALDHARLAKLGFLFGLALFVIGSGGEMVGHALFGQLPPWEVTLLFDIEAAGLVIGFFSPFVFGVVLPLLE